MKDPLDTVLDELGTNADTVVVPTSTGTAEIDVAEADRIGVRIRRVRIEHTDPVDIRDEAERLASDVKALARPLQATEVDPRLGGAVLRTNVAAAPKREFFEVTVTPKQTTVEHHTIDPHGTRTQGTWNSTREQLRKLLKQVARPQTPDS